MVQSTAARRVMRPDCAPDDGRLAWRLRPSYSTRVSATRTWGRCPVCSDVVDRLQAAICDRCGASQHLDCQRFVGRCAIFGCEPTIGAPVPKIKPALGELQPRARSLTVCLAIALVSVLLMGTVSERAAKVDRLAITSDDTQNRGVTHKEKIKTRSPAITIGPMNTRPSSQPPQDGNEFSTLEKLFARIDSKLRKRRPPRECCFPSSRELLPANPSASYRETTSPLLRSPTVQGCRSQM